MFHTATYLIRRKISVEAANPLGSINGMQVDHTWRFDVCSLALPSLQPLFLQRFLINLREVDNPDNGTVDASHVTTLMFRPSTVSNNIVGNLGQLLEVGEHIGDNQEADLYELEEVVTQPSPLSADLVIHTVEDFRS